MGRFIFSILTFSVLLCACQKSEENPDPSPPELPYKYLTSLDEVLKESSGLVNIQQQIWTHNDSDGASSVYRINPQTGLINHQFNLLNAENIDWEDLSANDSNLFISDTGNNYGLRKTFQIYIVALSLLEQPEGEAEKIIFSYPDQPDTTDHGADLNFDCEAIVAVEDSLFLFTKRHEDLMTRIYSLPAKKGMYQARKEKVFDAEGLVTAAAYDPDDHLLCLVAYNKDKDSGDFSPFVWLFYDFPGTRFFEGKRQKVDLMINAQFEGLCYQKNGVFLLSTENSSASAAGLYEMDALKWIQ